MTRPLDLFPRIPHKRRGGRFPDARACPRCGSPIDARAPISRRSAGALGWMAYCSACDGNARVRGSRKPPIPPQLDRLVASSPRRPRLNAVLLATAVALTVHAAVMYGAMAVTRPAREPVAVHRPDTVLIDIAWPRESVHSPPGLAMVSASPEGGPVAASPTMIDVPRGARPIDLGPLSGAPRPVLRRRPVCTAAVCVQEPPRAGSVALVAPDARPEILSSPQVQYPRLLWAAGIEGVVIVTFVVDTLGRADPSSIEIVQSTNVGFNRSAKTMIREIRFRPGLVGGTAARVASRIRIDFRLNGIRSVGTF